MFSKYFKNMIISIGLFILYIVFTSLFVVKSFQVKNDIVFATVFPQILSSIITIYIVSIIYKDIIIKNLKSIKKDFNIKLFLTGIILIIASIIMDTLLKNMLGRDSSNNSAIIETIKSYKYIYALFVIFIGPFFKELIFRLPYNKNKNIITFIECIIIFVLLHIQSTKDLIFIIPYFLVTFAITLNYFKTDNIFISYLIHLINNLINVLLLIW